LRSNIAAEARAKIVYERLINLTEDPGVREALGFLMTREIAHQKSFEKALYSIKPNFPPGKTQGDPRFTNVYFNMSRGPGDTTGPWNDGKQWDRRDDDVMSPADGGPGDAQVELDAGQQALVDQLTARTASTQDGDPLTGAEIGSADPNLSKQIKKP